MTFVGIIYLVFEKRILSKTRMADDSTAPADDLLSRTLVAIQV